MARHRAPASDPGTCARAGLGCIIASVEIANAVVLIGSFTHDRKPFGLPRSLGSFIRISMNRNMTKC
jgi:hypothetical protein